MITDVSVNSILEKAFTNFTVDGVYFPIYPLKAPENNFKNYLTYHSYNTQPNLFGDDMPVSAISYGTIDVFCESNYLKVVAEVKKVLLEHKFTWNGDGFPDYEEDTKLYHYPINFIKESEEEI